MKIIDFEKKGNVVRFYLGEDDLADYWGDDWNDAPYDCNAGSVYDHYISGYVDIAFPFDSTVLEPCNGCCNCSYTKDDMKEGIVPCIIVVPKEMVDVASWHDHEFAYWVGAKNIAAVYFGDPVQKLTEHHFGNAIYVCTQLNGSQGDAA